MSSRRDLYGECNVEGAPEPLFKAACCDHCRNPDCDRSKYGTTFFDKRIGTWEDRLFLKVPKMTLDDPRYPALSRQGFTTIDVSRTPDIRTSWDDPRDVREPERNVTPPAPAITPPPKLAPPEEARLPPNFPSLRFQAAEAAPEPPPVPEPAPTPPVAVERPPTPAMRPPSPMNTPHQSGRMLSGTGAPTTLQAVEGDKWSSPAPLPTPAAPEQANTRVVPRGAKIKLGG